MSRQAKAYFPKIKISKVQLCPRGSTNQPFNRRNYHSISKNKAKQSNPPKQSNDTKTQKTCHSKDFQKIPVGHFPDHLGSIVAGSGDERERTLDPVFEEELETFLPNGFVLEREIVDYEREDEEERVDGELGLSKLGKRVDNEVGVSISVREILLADEKRSDLEYELSQREINLEKLQRIASSGLPDGGTLRATTWKLLLGYLPESRDSWGKELAENRSKYTKLKDELLSTPSEFSRKKDEGSNAKERSGNSEIKGTLERHNVSNEDHPLNLGKSSVWNRFFQFTEISDQIDRDLERTHPDLKFFSRETALSRRNREAMRNILLLFAKLNPEIRYVQGMNEVLAPIYYVFSTDTDEENAANAEADSFSCFVRLLSDSVDHFCQQLDNSPVGIHSTLCRLSEMLKATDEELWRHLVYKNKVNPQFFAFRWITLLLTQEFDFHSVLRMWDSLLSSAFGVQDMLLRVCCAMLVCVKSKLMSGDFIANMKLLQHYPKINIEHLLLFAKDISPDTSTFRLTL